jgi:hypothetical protein
LIFPLLSANTYDTFNEHNSVIEIRIWRFILICGCMDLIIGGEKNWQNYPVREFMGRQKGKDPGPASGPQGLNPQGGPGFQ